jgi:hypothetical protein
MWWLKMRCSRREPKLSWTAEDFARVDVITNAMLMLTESTSRMAGKKENGGETPQCSTNKAVCSASPGAFHGRFLLPQYCVPSGAQQT